MPWNLDSLKSSDSLPRLFLALSSHMLSPPALCRWHLLWLPWLQPSHLREQFCFLQETLPLRQEKEWISLRMLREKASATNKVNILLWCSFFFFFNWDNFNHFIVYNSVDFSTFTVLCKHHWCIIHHPKRKPVPVKHSVPIPVVVLGTLIAFFFFF